jgi:hypothetical protein
LNHEVQFFNILKTESAGAPNLPHLFFSSQKIVEGYSSPPRSLKLPAADGKA